MRFLLFLALLLSGAAQAQNITSSPSTAPTAAFGDFSTRIATTAFVTTNAGVLMNTAGGSLQFPHTVLGTAALSTGTVTVTFSGNAVYTSSATYACSASDTGGSALAASTQNLSASQFKIFGTVSDTVNFICVGN